MAHGQEVVGSNPGTEYWMDVSDLLAITLKTIEVKVAKWGTPKKKKNLKGVKSENECQCWKLSSNYHTGKKTIHWAEKFLKLNVQETFNSARKILIRISKGHIVKDSNNSKIWREETFLQFQGLGWIFFKWLQLTLLNFFNSYWPFDTILM